MRGSGHVDSFVGPISGLGSILAQKSKFRLWQLGEGQRAKVEILKGGDRSPPQIKSHWCSQRQWYDQGMIHEAGMWIWNQQSVAEYEIVQYKISYPNWAFFLLYENILNKSKATLRFLPSDARFRFGFPLTLDQFFGLIGLSNQGGCS